MARRYPVQTAPEWVMPARRGFRLACCDCGLVHVMDFRVRKGRAQFRADRDNRKTAALRREGRKRGDYAC